jgi:hypothetical protein
LNVASFSSARDLVSGLIQVSESIVSCIASSRFFTSSCMRALASGGKYFSTYLRPSASPSRLSVSSTHRFQRGFISVAPLRNAPRNLNSSSTKAFDSDGAAESRTCHLR